jgi:hypothetical protein
MTMTDEEMQKVQDQDLRRQHQIQNQSKAIDRLLDGENTYSAEMKTLHEMLAKCQLGRDTAVRQLAQLQAELAGDG